MALKKKFFYVMHQTHFFSYKKIFVFIFVFAASIASTTPVFANNLSISNVTISARDASANTATVSFDISWSNSWRNQENYDASWVFIKFKIGSGNWTHATLKTAGTNPTGFSTGSGTAIEIIVPSTVGDSPGLKGGFIQRSAVGSGSLSTTSVKFVWDYATDGVADTDSVTVKVFGIEMVYIPAGSFYAGDGASSNIMGHFESAASGATLQITSEASLTLGGSGGGSLGNNNAAGMFTADDFNDGTSKTLPAAFPKGYAAFYLMKYETTQGQYVDFLNTLTRPQQQTRVAATLADTMTNIYVLTNTASISNRNTVRCPATGNGSSGSGTPVVFSTTRADRACNYLSWMDGAAFADWAGLRHMTELEFERAARGTQTVVAGEMAWGSTAVTAAATISGTEDGTETISTASANCNYNNVTFSGGDASSGPLRSGIFATSSSTRVASGAGYYGNMELTGNLWEQTVSVGHATGRSFTGTHGDGTLTTTTSYEGNATNTDWPGIDGTPSNGVTGAAGGGIRGDGWDADATYAPISNRYGAAMAVSTRSSVRGFRGARTV